MRYIMVVLVGFILFSSSVMAAEKKMSAYTQKDFADLLMKQFAWDSGLPKEPSDRDYLVVLGGKRTFRYEAENAYNAATDNVSVSEFEIYGPFSGKGWVMGVATGTITHFTIMLPIAGDYTIKSTLKGDGFVWDVNGKKLTAGTKDKKLKEVEIGTVPLSAGVVQMTVTIPPDGGIDSFTLVGSDNVAVGPFAGWRFKEPLTAGAMAEIMVSATGQLDKLPVEKGALPRNVPVTSLSQLPEFTSLIDTDYLGHFSSKQWLRANYRGATIELPFTVDMLGLYDVAIQVLSEKVVAELNGTTVMIPGKQYLDRVTLGQFRLDSGASTLTLKLPPMGGFDALHILKRDSSPAAFMKLAGISGSPDRVVTKDEAEKLIKTLSPRTVIKK